MDETVIDTDGLSALEGLLTNEGISQHTLLPLLDPIDLVRLMHTSKATRRIAAPILNKLETGANNQTKCHTEMFRKFLRCPRITKDNKVWDELIHPSDNKRICGPLRLNSIAALASDIEKRFAILSYEKSYDKENSLVILFDGGGAYIGHYSFSNSQFYEDYHTEDIMTGNGERVFNSRGDTNTSMPKISLRTPCRTPWSTYGTNIDDVKWGRAFSVQTDYYWQEEWLGDVLGPHNILIESFAGVLSPTEAMFTLMHALSSDTRIIYVMTVKGFFYNLRGDFDHYFSEGFGEEEEEDDEERADQWLMLLNQRLLQVSYENENVDPLPDPSTNITSGDMHHQIQLLGFSNYSGNEMGNITSRGMHHQLQLGNDNDPMNDTDGLSALEDLLINNDIWRDTLLPYLDPIDLIRLMHTSKATRRVAAPMLNKLETGSLSSVCHTKMFRQFLRCPRITEDNEVWEELTNPSDDNIAGPLRINTIAALASDIEKRFAILHYAKSFDKEATLVILFDENGSYTGHYSFSCIQFYEDYATKDIMWSGAHFGGRRVINSSGERNTSMPNIRLVSTDSGRWHDATGESMWREPNIAQTNYDWSDGWIGSVLDPHMTLIESLAGVLSPTEAMFVLMHALSSDTRAIYVMTVSFFDQLASNFDWSWSGSGADERLQALRQKLSHVYGIMED